MLSKGELMLDAGGNIEVVSTFDIAGLADYSNNACHFFEFKNPILNEGIGESRFKYYAAKYIQEKEVSKFSAKRISRLLLNINLATSDKKWFAISKLSKVETLLSYKQGFQPSDSLVYKNPVLLLSSLEISSIIWLSNKESLMLCINNSNSCHLYYSDSSNYNANSLLTNKCLFDYFYEA